ncbi:uncharacterized protein LOC124654649 [Lolium rigidum]|uniref:uncharacterized protein LOC124654649 n=1 Tax=Lolium rigidum TaxID=89674 RepID=UPI001F5C705C|nr:uncharacterized protein LOC124654649 [Lolium rigidum]
MAPPLQTIRRRSEGTGRCASSSSSTWFKESSRGALNQAQGRRFSSMAAMLRRRFRPPSSSSGQTEHTTGFLMFSRTSDAISLLLVRPEPSNPPPTRAFRHGCVCSRSSLRFDLKRGVPRHNQHQLQQPSDLVAGYASVMQSRTKINKSSPAQLIRQRASTQIDPAQQHQLARRCSICFFPDRIAKWSCEIQRLPGRARTQLSQRSSSRGAALENAFDANGRVEKFGGGAACIWSPERRPGQCLTVAHGGPRWDDKPEREEGRGEF